MARIADEISLYHGSSSLVRYKSPFPVGLKYYGAIPHVDIDYRTLDSKLSVAQQDSHTYQNLISPGWYGSLSVAKVYSEQTDEGSCGNGCLLAYKTLRPLNLILLSDPDNLDKIANMILNPRIYKEDDFNALTKVWW